MGGIPVCFVEIVACELWDWWDLNARNGSREGSRSLDSDCDF